MIAFLTVPIGISLLSLQGMLLLRLVEGKHPVLHPVERFCGGIFVGQAWSAYLLFGVALFGLTLRPLFVIGFHVVFLAALMLFFLWRKGSVRLVFQNGVVDAPPALLPPRWLRIIGFLLVFLLAIKLLLATSDLLLTPTYFNDAYANWNMRTKVFFTHQNLLLDRNPSDPFFFGGRVPSYPLTVYFTKLLLVSFAGAWSDAVANSIHIAWFLVTLGILWSALRQKCGSHIAWGGVIILTGMPLVLVHSFSAYADLVLAGHLLFSLLCFYEWIRSAGEGRQTWLRLLGLSLGAMIFLKNEATMIFLPVFGVLGAVVLLMEWRGVRYQKTEDRRQKTEDRRQKTEDRGQISGVHSILFAVGSVLVVLLPWSFFKFSHALDFGNAHTVSSMVLAPHAGVPAAIWDAIMYTGSFLIFIPVFLYLLVRTMRFWMRGTLGFLVIFLLVVFVGEFFIFYLTELATEALRHTGFSRGVLQLMPSAVFVGGLLVYGLLVDGGEEGENA